MSAAESYAVMEPVMRLEALDQLRERLGTLVPILSSLPLLSFEQIQKQVCVLVYACGCSLQLRNSPLPFMLSRKI